MKKRQNNSVVDILGSIGDGFVSIFKGIFRLILKLFIAFGIWLPTCYALLGVVLFFSCDFDPFDFSLYSVIYLSGAVACLVCCVIISVRNIIVLPVKTAVTRKRERKAEEEWLETERAAQEKYQNYKDNKKEIELSPPLTEKSEYEDLDDDDEDMPEYLPKSKDFRKRSRDEEREEASSLLFDWTPKKINPRTTPNVVSEPKKEIPEIYFSKLHPNVLVHEYSDRFELYKTVGDKTVSVGVEYK